MGILPCEFANGQSVQSLKIDGTDTNNGTLTQNAVKPGGMPSSRLSFKGEEALGNGLKAVFTLELGSLAIDSAIYDIGNTRLSFVV